MLHPSLLIELPSEQKLVVVVVLVGVVGVVCIFGVVECCRCCRAESAEDVFIATAAQASGWRSANVSC